MDEQLSLTELAKVLEKVIGDGTIDSSATIHLEIKGVTVDFDVVEVISSENKVLFCIK